MSNTDNNLLAGEAIVYRTTKHWVIFVVPALLTLVMLYIYKINPYFLQSINTSLPWSSINILANLSFYLPVLIVLFYWVNAGLEYITAEFTITNYRIIMQEGFFKQHKNETQLTAIAGVSMEQSLLGRMLNYGSISINSFGGGTDPFEIIAFPRQFQIKLQEQLHIKN